MQLNKLSKSFSIVIPVYNEEESITKLVKEIQLNIPEKNYNYEIIIINDNSIDNTKTILKKLSSKSNINYFSNDKNMGQSFSLFRGVKESKYSVIVSIDGDGQNNPIDIVKLLTLYNSSENLKLVGGIRQKRKDSIIKIISSKIANNVRSFILNDECPDTGCSLKVFDKQVFLSFPFFSGIHRFLPALFKSFGYNTEFINVDHRKRSAGKSKYGIFDRLLKGIIDIFKVIIIINNIKKK